MGEHGLGCVRGALPEICRACCPVSFRQPRPENSGRGKEFKPVSAVLAAMGCGGRPTQFSFARGSPFRLSTFGQNGKNSPCGKEFKPVSAVLAAAALVCPRLSETAKTARKQTAAAKYGCAWHRRKKKEAPVKPELSQR